MNAFLARLRRGCAHVWARAKEWAWERPRAFLAGVPWVRWRAQMAEAAETKAGLRHMLEVASVDEPTDDQRIGLIRMEEGYQLQRRTLLRRQEEQGGELTTPQLYELHAIDKALAELRLKREGATPETVGRFQMRSFAAVGAATGILGGVRLWMVLAAGWALTGAWGLVQYGLKERIEDQRDRARAERDAAERSRAAYARQLSTERAQHRRDMAQVLEDTAETVEQLRRREARNRARAERERSRSEDLASGNINFGERLRELAEPDAGLPSGSTTAPSGDPASRVPIGAGRNSQTDSPR